MERSKSEGEVSSNIGEEEEEYSDDFEPESESPCSQRIGGESEIHRILQEIESAESLHDSGSELQSHEILKMLQEVSQSTEDKSRSAADIIKEMEDLESRMAASVREQNDMSDIAEELPSEKTEEEEEDKFLQDDLKNESGELVKESEELELKLVNSEIAENPYLEDMPVKESTEEFQPKSSASHNHEIASFLGTETLQINLPAENPIKVVQPEPSATPKDGMSVFLDVLGSEVRKEIAAALHHVENHSDEMQSELVQADDTLFRMSDVDLDDIPKVHTQSVKDLVEDDFDKACFTSSSEEKFLEEQQRCLKLTALLESKEQEKAKTVVELEQKYNQENFELKKEIYFLTAKIETLEKKAKEDGERQNSTVDRASKSQQVKLLEEEVKKQERLIVGYQAENEKLYSQLRKMKEDVRVKEENMAKEKELLQADIIALRHRHADTESKPLFQGLQMELLEKNQLIQEMGKQLQRHEERNSTLLTAVENQRNEIEKLQVMLNERNSQLDEANVALATSRISSEGRLKAQLKEKDKVIEITKKELQSYKDQLAKVNKDYGEQTSKLKKDLKLKDNDIRILKKKLSMNTRTNADATEFQKKTDALNLKVKELEEYLKIKNPNSIPALIRAANKEVKSDKTKHLENRIEELEQELKQKDESSKIQIKSLQEEFHRIKEKYETCLEEIAQRQSCQSSALVASSSSPEIPIKEGIVKKDATVKRLQSRGREDASLLAAVRNLKEDIANKDKEIHLLKKEISSLKKASIKVKKEQERIISTNKDSTKVNVEDVEKYSALQLQIQTLANKLQSQKAFYEEKLAFVQVEKKSIGERAAQEYGRVLQARHEAEIQKLKADFAVRHSSSQVSDLQFKLQSQDTVIQNLKSQLQQMEEYKMKYEFLLTENASLQEHVSKLHRKLDQTKQFLSPDQKVLDLIQEKVQDLEVRFRFREEQLQSLLMSLHKQVAQQGKPNYSSVEEEIRLRNQQLANYRLQMNALMDTLQELIH